MLFICIRARAIFSPFKKIIIFIIIQYNHRHNCKETNKEKAKKHHSSQVEHSLINFREEMNYQNNSQYVTQSSQYASPNYAQANNFQHNQAQHQMANSEMATTHNLHLVLLGMADLFQRLNQYRLVIHSLESILTMRFQDMPIATNLQIQLKTRLNLCRLYLKHTNNTNQYVNAHLEKSVRIISFFFLNFAASRTFMFFFLVATFSSGTFRKLYTLVLFP